MTNTATTADQVTDFLADVVTIAAAEFAGRIGLTVGQALAALERHDSEGEMVGIILDTARRNRDAGMGATEALAAAARRAGLELANAFTAASAAA